MKVLLWTLLLILAVLNVISHYQMNKELRTCYNSGEITSPDGKKFQCLWLNSDAWAEKQEGDK